MKALTKLFFVGCLTLIMFSASAQTDVDKKTWIEKNRQEYINQGGQIDQVPEFNTKQEKINWVNENLAPNQISPNADIIFMKKATEARETVILADEPTFPVYVNTGNQAQDDAAYNQKKQAWISQNQAKYDAMFPAENPMPRDQRLKLDSEIQNQ